MRFIVQVVFAREDVNDFAGLGRQGTRLLCHILDVFFANFAHGERHDSLGVQGTHVLTRNAHVHIVHIDASRIFNDLDSLLQCFHYRIEFVGILEREIAAFHNANVFTFGNTHEQVYLRFTNVKAKDVFVFSFVLFIVIH